MCNCSICKRIEMIQEHKNNFFIKEFDSGYAVFADHQQFVGTVLFYAKEHVSHLEDLNEAMMKEYLYDMAKLQTSIRKAFKCDHVDCELIGTNDKHLHFQLYPRNDQDLPMYGENGNGPVYWCPRTVMFSHDNFPSPKDLDFLKKCIREEL